MRGIFIAIVLMFVSFGLSAQPKLDTVSASLFAKLKTARIDSTRVKILLELGNFYILKPGESKTDMDSAALLVKQAEQLASSLKSEVWLGRCYLMYAKLLGETHDFSKGKQYVELATKIFTKYNMKEALGDTYIASASFYNFMVNEELIEKIKRYQLAVACYEQAGAKSKLARELNFLGDLLYNNQQLIEAVKALRQSLDVSLSLHEKDLIGVYDLLGACYRNLGDQYQAIKYGLLAVKNIEELNDGANPSVRTVYNRLGLSYYSFNQYEPATTYFKKAVNIAIALKDTASIAVITMNIADVYRKLNNAAQALKLLKELEKNYPIESDGYHELLYATIVFAYVQLRDYESASFYIKKIDILAKTNGPTYLSCKARILYYLGIKSYPEVYTNCDMFEQYYKKTGMSDGLSSVYLWRFEADSALGNYVSAIKNFQQFKSMEDSVYNQKNSNQIALLDVEYETDKKNNDIKSKEENIQLLTRQAQLQQTEIKQARFVRNVIIVAVLGMSVLLGLLYRQYILKRKSNKQLLIKQQEINSKNNSLEKLVGEKEWLVKEIHHRVKNNLQIVMSLLNTQSAYSENEQSFAAIRESRQRMYAMSLIHQKLYQADNMTLVNMSSYIPELISFLKDSFAEGDRIHFELDIINIDLDISQAVPLGLILNEAITNAIKYAFGDIIKGTIQVMMKFSKNGNLVLKVKDNGKGFPADVDKHKKGSMGITLMETLAEQLDGSITFENDNGLTVTVIFKQQLLTNIENNSTQKD